MKDKKLNEKINAIREHFNEKLNDNMKLKNNKYGCEFFWFHSDQWVKLKEKNILDKGVMCITEYSNGNDKPGESKTVNASNFSRFFNTTDYTWETFVKDIMAAKKVVLEERLHSNQNKSEATLAIDHIINGGEDTRTKNVKLFTSYKFRNKYTEQDDYFVFNRVFKDKDLNLYINLNNKLYNLMIKKGTERELLGNSLDDETQFWPSFFKQFNADFDNWAKLTYQTIESFDWDNEPVSLEEKLMSAGVPRTFLECISININQIGIDEPTGKGDTTKRKWYYGSCSIVPDNGKDSTWSLEDQIQVLSKRLILPVDVSRTKTIPTFSNDENEVAVKHIKLPVAFKHTEEPKLPKQWEMFFGNGRFYDEKMDKLKIAHFIYCVLNAKFTGRQVLVVGGQGNDGKGVFLNILTDLIGEDYVSNMAVSDFTPDDRFGMVKAFNKKLLYLSDCKSVSKLFSEDKFKALSGGDMITLEKKNLNPINWKPQGLCVAVATNNSFYVNDEHGRTRAMPIVFRKNFDEKDIIPKGEMINRLLSEKDEFIQWCVDYRQWMFEQYPQLLNGEALLMCTDEDLVKLKGDYDAFTLFKTMCEKQKLGDRKFCNWNARTEEEEEIQIMAEETWEEHLTSYINKISIRNKDDNELVFKFRDLIAIINKEITPYRLPGEPETIDNENLSKDIEMFFRQKKVSMTNKDDARESIEKWLNSNTKYDMSHYRDTNYKVNGKRKTGFIIIKNSWNLNSVI